jgi:Ca2+/H+ antiporter, TMEM165/GDT1 family
MFSSWMHLGPSALAGFLASSVECVEALTVILAVGTISTASAAAVPLSAPRQPRVARLSVRQGAGTDFTADTADICRRLAVDFRNTLAEEIDSAFRRHHSLHDEAATFAAEQRRLGSASAGSGYDLLALTTAFQITMLEGAEVVFIVLGISVGGPELTKAAIISAIAALLVTSAIGVMVHRPLANVPENLLKFIVGILLTAFGAFWFGEGAGIAWPGQEASLVALTLGFFVVAIATIRLCRKTRHKDFDAVAPGIGR